MIALRRLKSINVKKVVRKLSQNIIPKPQTMSHHQSEAEPDGKFCHGTKRQSPIDLVTSALVFTKQSGIFFANEFYDEPLTQDLTADSHSVVIKSTFAETPYIAGGPLKDCYKLNSIHFHWGTEKNLGSEHTLNGKSYPMEMHVVFTRGNLTMEEAKVDPEGISVIGYFINELPDCPEKSPKNPFSIIAKTMGRLEAVDQPTPMRTNFAIAHLAIPFNFNFLTYEGSLTTGDCQEVVTWLISPNILKITQRQLNAFRNLFTRNLVEHPTNYRKTQAPNGRKVYFVKGRRTTNHKGT